MPENRGTLADYLQRALDKRDWSKAQLARESGVPESNIGRYLDASKRSVPTIDNARRLAVALDVPLKKFVVDVGLFDAKELDAEIPQPPAKAPADMTDDELAEALEEAARRFRVRSRNLTAAELVEQFEVVDPKAPTKARRSRRPS